jgi:hypothetical protein
MNIFWWKRVLRQSALSSAVAHVYRDLPWSIEEQAVRCDFRAHEYDNGLQHGYGEVSATLPDLRVGACSRSLTALPPDLLANYTTDRDRCYETHHQSS